MGTRSARLQYGASAGKSTLLNLLCGVTQVDSGEILFEGQDIGRLPVHGFARAGIVRKFQTPAVFTSLSTRENLRIAGDAVGIFYADAEIDKMLERIALIAEAHTCAGDLAHGKKQWLEMGLCLMTRPKLLLLDEPTAGMTDAETLATVILLKSLAADIATVVIEHDMSFVRELNVRTCVMHQGEIVRDSSFVDIEKDPFIQ